jgi:hypothetical protein
MQSESLPPATTRADAAVAAGPEVNIDALAFAIFKLFAQYECALKAMGFVKAGHGGRAEPDWDRFVREVGRNLVTGSDREIADARRYLLSNPPKKQIVDSGRVKWQAVDNRDKSAAALFGHIRRVRNNLYHGGKFHRRWIEPDRSLLLLRCALTLLDALVRKDRNLERALAANQT